MEKFKENEKWMFEKESPCKDCSNSGMCMEVECDDFDLWENTQETSEALNDGWRN